MAVESAEVFADFTDAEVVLVALVLESGFRLRSTDAETSVVLNQMLEAVTTAELQRREVHPMSTGRMLMERVCNRLPKEV